jgi:hypothetical protein
MKKTPIYSPKSHSRKIIINKKAYFKQKYLQQYYAYLFFL